MTLRKNWIVADRKARFALVSYFEKVCKSKPVNRYSAQWDADALLQSYGDQVCRQLIDRYANLAVAPTWTNFAKNADRLYNGMLEQKADLENRKKIKQRMKEWLSE